MFVSASEPARCPSFNLIVRTKTYVSSNFKPAGRFGYTAVSSDWFYLALWTKHKKDTLAHTDTLTLEVGA